MEAPAAPAMEAPAAPAMEAPSAPAMEAPVGMDQGLMELAPIEQPVEQEQEQEEEQEEPQPIENVTDVIKTINPYDSKQIILAFATLIGAFGGFPSPPRQFTELSGNEWFRWLMVAILVFQGAGGQDPRLAATVTAIGYVGYKYLERR